MGFVFIKDFIFLVKKIFWIKFQKLASEIIFDLEQKNISFLENDRIRFYYSLASSPNIISSINFYFFDDKIITLFKFKGINEKMKKMSL